MTAKATELWMSHLSVSHWNNAEAWDNYLRTVESLLGDRLAKLDVNDPPKRKADVAHGEGGYVTQYGPKEDSRWLFGKFEKSGIMLQIRQQKDQTDSFGRLSDNSIDFWIPQDQATRIGTDRLAELFRLNNERWSAFYAYADLKEVICAKKPSPPSLGSLDVSRELLGVFWLTFFGFQYCEYFGRERVAKLDRASDGPSGGITLRLAETPNGVAKNQRDLMERAIAIHSFAGSGQHKERGQYALTLEQLVSPVARLH